LVREKRGLSIILIEHVMPAVMRLSDRVIVLDAGKKIAEGKPQQVVSDPRVVAAYLGESASAAARAHPGAATAPTPATGSGPASHPTPPSHPTPTATAPSRGDKGPGGRA
jgi:ABC-type sugar transport system ATPase subunit